jgi:hypothetical protein
MGYPAGEEEKRCALVQIEWTEDKSVVVIEIANVIEYHQANNQTTQQIDEIEALPGRRPGGGIHLGHNPPGKLFTCLLAPGPSPIDARSRARQLVSTTQRNGIF